MKIAYLAHERIFPGGYISVHIEGVVKALSEKGHRVILIMPAWGRVRPFAPVEIHYVPILNIKGLQFFLGVLLWPIYLFYKFINNPPDAVYVRCNPTLGLGVMLLSKVLRIPIVTEINGVLLPLQTLANGVLLSRATSVSFLRKIIKTISEALHFIMIKTADRLLSVTPKLKKWLISGSCS